MGRPGRPAFAREARARDEGREPVLLTFPAPLDKEATTTLRRAGFRFSRVMQHWEGLARMDEARALAKAHGGAARQVGAGFGSAPPSLEESEAAE